MKKIVLFFLLCTPVLLSSQVSFGLTIGAHYAKEDFKLGNELQELGDINSFQIGLAMSTNFTDLIKLKGNLLYNINGFEDPTGVSRFKQNIHAEVRLAARLLEGLYIEGGPFVALLVDTDEGISKDAYKNISIGVTPQLTLNLGQTLELGAYYQLGLNDISDLNFTDQNGNPIDGSIKGHQYGLRLSFFLN